MTPVVCEMGRSVTSSSTSSVVMENCGDLVIGWGRTVGRGLIGLSISSSSSSSIGDSVV